MSFLRQDATGFPISFHSNARHPWQGFASLAGHCAREVKKECEIILLGSSASQGEESTPSKLSWASAVAPGALGEERGRDWP